MSNTLLDRRPLSFARVDDVLADIDTLAAADEANGLRTTGQWSFGQSLNHQATWVDYGYDGVPMRVPLPVRLVMRMMERRTLYKPMRPGMRLPKVTGGTLATDALSMATGLGHARVAFGRLRAESPARPHLLFGPMTHDE